MTTCCFYFGPFQWGTFIIVTSTNTDSFYITTENITIINLTHNSKFGKAKRKKKLPRYSTDELTELRNTTLFQCINLKTEQESKHSRQNIRDPYLE